MTGRTTIIVGVVAAMSLLIACSGDGGKTSGSPTGQAGPAKASAFDQVLEQIRRDGDVTLPTALQAFSLAFGDLPGVAIPDGPRVPVVYGGGPLRWIERYWDQLAPDQKSAAVQRLGFDPAATVAPKTTRAGGGAGVELVGRQSCKEAALGEWHPRPVEYVMVRRDRGAGDGHP